MPYGFESYIRVYRDYPVAGMIFRDFAPVFAHSGCLCEIKYEMIKELAARGIKPTKIFGIDSHGLVVGSLLAESLNSGLIMLRKTGKLPGRTQSLQYDLTQKYGQNIEMQKGFVASDDVVLIHDDILTTGGTAMAAVELAILAGVKKENIKLCFISEVLSCNAQERLKGYEYFSLVKFDSMSTM